VIVDLLRKAAGAIRPSTLLERRAARAPRTKSRAGSPPAATSPTSPTSGPLVVDGVTVEYTPVLDGAPDPGEVVWAWVAFEEDPSRGKDRPVVVIGRRAQRLVGVALTSKRDDRDPQVPIGAGLWDREGRTSFAKLDRLIPIDPQAVRREGAILDRDHFDALIDGLRRLHRTDTGHD
jgi:hypothetical protein